MHKEITLDLSLNSVKNAIKEIKNLKKYISVIQQEFAKESIIWIQETANYNLRSRTNFKGTTDIENSWIVNQVQPQYGGELAFELRNDSPHSALVEFGTGPYGGQEPHDMAKIVGYEYGKKTWSFVRDLTTNEWVVSPTISYEQIREEPDRYLVMNKYDGYVGKSYLYDAIFDYFHHDKWKDIYKKVFQKYIK